MDLSRRRFLVYALLAGVWALVVVWQVEEHRRVREYARTNLRNRSKDVANTLGAFIRTLEFRGRVVFSDRLQPVLNELVYGRTNELGIPSEVLFVAVLNTAGEALASAGTAPTNVDQRDFQQGERWGRRSLTVAYPVLGLLTNLPVLVDAPTNRMRGRFNPRGEPPSDFGPPPGPPEGDTNRPPPSTLAREGDPERPGAPP